MMKEKIIALSASLICIVFFLFLSLIIKEPWVKDGLYFLTPIMVLMIPIICVLILKNYMKLKKRESNNFIR
ncbi:hypothetical protein EWJ54_20675 [Salmonella enterica subsp. enterica serovar Brunei]|nr:hypothetical protein [Salmonella enterica subsp. enterica serovar Brunei]